MLVAILILPAGRQPREDPGEVEVRVRLDDDDAVRGRQGRGEELGRVVAGEGGADDDDVLAGGLVRGGEGFVEEAVEGGGEGVLEVLEEGGEGVGEDAEEEVGFLEEGGGGHRWVWLVGAVLCGWKWRF